MSRVFEMRRCRAFVGILAIAMIIQLVAAPPGRADQSTENDNAEKIRAELQKVGEEYLAAYNRHDAAAVASFSTADSELIKWSGDIVRGKHDIERFFTKTFRDNPNLHMENELESFRVLSPDAVMTFGRLKFTGKSKNWPTESKFAVLWEKVGGKWKALFDAGFVATGSAP